jgi:uroporphyrinogen-III synthase
MNLILRPKAKLANSIARFREAGMEAIGCGLIDTIETPLAASFLPDLRDLQADIIVVTSTVSADIYINALTKAALASKQDNPVPNSVFIAVGASTAKKISSLHSRVLEAEPSSSEGIIACVERLKLKSAKVAILKGKGGRGLITSSLTEKGFTVTEFDLYERLALKDAYFTERFEPKDIQCIIATSSEIIDAAYNYFEPHWLNELQWIVVSKRTKLHLSALGAKDIFTSNGATDSHLIAAANQVKGSQNE